MKKQKQQEFGKEVAESSVLREAVLDLFEFKETIGDHRKAMHGKEDLVRKLLRAENKKSISIETPEGQKVTSRLVATGEKVITTIDKNGKKKSSNDFLEN